MLAGVSKLNEFFISGRVTSGTLDLKELSFFGIASSSLLPIFELEGLGVKTGSDDSGYDTDATEKGTESGT